MNGHLKVVRGIGPSLALSDFPKKSAVLLSTLAAFARGLEDHPEASAAARDALQDPNVFVRNKASEMLSALEPPPRSPQPSGNRAPAQSQEENAR